MANAVYPEYKEFLISGAATVSLNVDDATDGPFIQLTDAGAYTYSSAHSFYSDVVAGLVGAVVRLDNPTVANGVFDADNITFTAVSGAQSEALIIYRHNAGANTTWKLVLYQDTGVTNLPVTPNGGDITVTFDAAGIIAF